MTKVGDGGNFNFLLPITASAYRSENIQRLRKKSASLAVKKGMKRENNYRQRIPRPYSNNLNPIDSMCMAQKRNIEDACL